jgi:hypothetical protein
MTNVSEWSTSAGSNNAAPPAGWPENMLPGKVNDCAREMMAALAKWYQDSTASLTTAGTGVAYTLATNSVHAAFSDIPLLSFKIHTVSTGVCTLNVDGLGAKPLRKTGSLGDYAAGELVAGQTLVVQYNSGTDDFEAIGPTPSEFVAGTKMLFEQTAAPTGWTKNTTHNDKALRLVSGAASSGGTTAFTSVFASRTLLQANLPSYNLSLASLTGSVGTAITNGADVTRNFSESNNNNSQSGGGSNIVNSVSWDEDTLALASGTVAFGGTLPSGGSGTAVDFDVQYVDVIMATKNA